MAEIIPSLNSCIRRMQAGERRFARRLASHLEDDYICWYDLPVGARPKYADFIILHPTRGLLLLEVKDWKLDTIHRINRDSVELLTSAGLKTTANPLAQVRQCTFLLIDQLKNDPQLIHQVGQFRGNLIMPYGFGVVLSNISRKEFLNTDLGEVIPEYQTICRDEMVESIDIEAFQKRLWDMFNVQFRSTLTLPQIDRVRWHIFPELRVTPSAQRELVPVEAADSVTAIPDIVRVMDMQQEKLARGLGSGHRVIHGVAGSGKTMILGFRCLHLANALHQPVLVLCYNITLAARLKAMMEEHGVSDKVNVYNFHKWCREMLRRYHIRFEGSGEEVFDRIVDAVTKAVADKRIPRGQYGAVLIDEGHDFKPEWLQLVTDMVDPDANSLLLLYDDAQSIYRHEGHLNFSLSSVGIQARGRTTVLRLNYRNTDEILNFAYRFIGKYLSPSECDEDHVPIVEPNAAGRHGHEPVVRLETSFEEEAQYIARVFRSLNEKRDILWRDMCVTYCHKWMGERLAEKLLAAGIPATLLHGSKAKNAFSFDQDTVKIMTMHSSKGLEFHTVAVCGIDRMGKSSERSRDDAKLLYVAMTRATENLLLTMSNKTEFTEGLLAA